MNPQPRLHHSAYQIAPGTLKLVIELFGILDCKVTFQPRNENKWVMIGQDKLRYDIQLVETDKESLSATKEKVGTHVAFIVDDPKKHIERVEKWAMERKLEFYKGGWSETELYFDLPDVFMNFVVEIMATSVEEG